MSVADVAALDSPGLVARCLAGHQTAMVELVSRYTCLVFGLCYRMLGHRQDAEDAAQETFMRALKSLHHWDATRSFEPWLLAIAGNRCRTALANRKRKPTPDVLVESPADTRPQFAEKEWLAEDVQWALQQLRPEYRQAFVLFHEQYQGYGQIAEILDVPLGTVKTWVYRARRELTDLLASRGWGNDSGEPSPESNPTSATATPSKAGSFRKGDCR